MDVFNSEQLFTMGATMAKIHIASNDYKAPYERRVMDLDFLVDRPIARLTRILGSKPHRAKDLELLISSAKEAREEILEIINNPSTTADGWGPIGGDFHSTNTFFTDDNVAHLLQL